jgi:hypothetical protein
VNLYTILSNRIINRSDHLGLVDWEFWKEVIKEVGKDLADPKAHAEAARQTRPFFGKRDRHATRRACDENNSPSTYRPKTTGANSKDKKQVDDAAKSAGLDDEQRRKFGDLIERLKGKTGRGGSDNFSYEQLQRLAEEFAKRGMR